MATVPEIRLISLIHHGEFMLIPVKEFILLIDQTIVFSIGLLVYFIFVLFDSLIRFLGAITGTTVAGSTSDSGPWSYQFSNPTAITFDQSGYMYVLDYSNDRIQKWLPGASFGVTVAATNLGNPRGMRFDRLSNIVVADTTYDRILSFSILCRKYLSIIFSLVFEL